MLYASLCLKWQKGIGYRWVVAVGDQYLNKLGELDTEDNALGKWYKWQARNFAHSHGYTAYI